MAEHQPFIRLEFEDSDRSGPPDAWAAWLIIGADRYRLACSYKGKEDIRDLGRGIAEALKIPLRVEGEPDGEGGR